MKLHVVSVTPNAQGGHDITISTEGEKAGAEKNLVILGQDLTDALQDGKLDAFELVRIASDAYRALRG